MGGWLSMVVTPHSVHLLNQILNLNRKRLVVLNQSLAILLHATHLLNKELGCLTLISFFLTLSKSFVCFNKVALTDADRSRQLVPLFLHLLLHSRHLAVEGDILLQK